MTTSFLASGDDGPNDVVGKRVLIGAQMVNISRLSTHPVPMTTSGLITVAGEGPTDSNGAGKSSFIAGLSLLHADDQWRLQSGAQAAAELLFTAELAGQEAMHANAEHGYIIGVFAPPGIEVIAELEGTVLTVWLRVNRQSPHLELRWADRLHLPYGETEDERAAGADALWNALPKSNGRTDLRANRLSKTLYGGTVRCVSFLSTSVRASPTANLLAQPLNELSPERIFDAIGALTGLTGELEQEQKARSKEHSNAAAATSAREQYDEWDGRMAAVEAGIRTRAEARTLLDEGEACWRSRCARYLIDGLTESESVADDLKANEKSRTQLAAEIAKAEKAFSQLTDDKAFELSYKTRVDTYNRVATQVKTLTDDHNRAVGQIETLSAQKRALDTAAEAADGLDVDGAAVARRKAEDALGAAQQAKGVTARARLEATKAVEAAERGEDIAAEQVQRLRTAGYAAAPLLDVVTLTEAQRPTWEARLLPYRRAVVVRPDDATKATEILANLPGSLLVHADNGTGQPGDERDVPRSADDRFTLITFLTALAERAGDELQHIDAAGGVRAVSGFAEALTGRAGRIQQARAILEVGVTADEDAGTAVTTARTRLGRAQEREHAAQAGARAAELGNQIDTLRRHNEANEKEQSKLASPLATATADHQAALAEAVGRANRIAAVRDLISRTNADLEAAMGRWYALTERREDLDLPGRHAAWGGTVDGAHQHILGLVEREQTMPLANWEDAADGLAERTRRTCFPPGTPADQLPEELRLVDEQRSSRRSHERTRLVPAVLRIIGAYLDQHAQVDKQQQAEIERQRAEKTATLSGAEQALTEARQASAALRGTIATAIKTKLKQVSAQFDRIDQAYGGYGGALEFPEPEPPADPEKPWRWSVTPKWRRGEGKPPSSYRLRGNTAQMDDKAVKLVCAAALAGTGDRPLMLVLDELGRNLGSAHRRDAVALFENIGRDHAISVVGALQDDMERYAISASSLYIKLRRNSDTMPYNQAPIVIGSDTNKARVQMLADWLTSYRPEPQT